VVCLEGAPSANLIIIGKGEYEVSQKIGMNERASNEPDLMDDSTIKAYVSHVGKVTLG
jgi:hypothetical protein